ncbi:hypothetical protein [Enterococcus rotai]|uniref:hypothetical protein n=1 Tax=Enterococcus rotai TaxID=118060 RepID=UPI0032B49349
MYYMYYSIENAVKNLIRTKGLVMTLLLMFLISCLTFTSYSLFTLFRAWKDALLNENNFIALIPVNIFCFLIAIVFLTLFTFLIFYTKNAFRSFFLIKKKEIQTMSFLGIHFMILSFEFAIQPVICLILLLPLSAFVGSTIVDQFRLDFMGNLDLALNSNNELIFLLFFSCMIVFFSIFFFIKRMITI